MPTFSVTIELESYTEIDIKEYIRNLNWSRSVPLYLIETNKGTYVATKVIPDWGKVVCKFLAMSEKHGRIIAGLLNAKKMSLTDIIK